MDKQHNIKANVDCVDYLALSPLTIQVFTTSQALCWILTWAGGFLTLHIEGGNNKRENSQTLTVIKQKWAVKREELLYPTPTSKVNIIQHLECVVQLRVCKKGQASAHSLPCVNRIQMPPPYAVECSCRSALQEWIWTPRVLWVIRHPITCCQHE